MKIVIIEDERLAAERLEDMIGEIDPTVEVMAQLSSVAESVAWLKIHKPDLVFLDIKLSDGISFMIFEKIRVDVPIIFTTAYDQYAIKAFKLNSIDYLLKPIRKSELVDSLEKFRSLKAAFQPDFSSLLQLVQNQKPDYKQRFLIQLGDRIKKVEVRDVAYFYAMEKYVFLTTFDKQTYPMDLSLDKLHNRIDPETFFRINRKMIVNFRAIQNMLRYSRSRIKLELNPPPPKGIESLVSVERTTNFRDWIDK